jgi:hypothetical protein
VNEAAAIQKDSPNRFWSWLIGVTLFVLGVLGLGLLLFSILGLSGQVATPIGPVKQHLSAADFASSAVAGATLLLAAVTVLLALFTRNSLALGRAELALAEKSLVAVQEQAAKLAEQVTATHVQAAAMQSQAAATQQQAVIAQRTLEASWRPFLVDIPWGSATRPTTWTIAGSADASTIYVRHDQQGKVTEVEVPLRNIGLGPALISKAGLSIGQLHADATSLSTAIVASGEIVSVGFKIPDDSENDTAVVMAITSSLAAHQPFVVTVFFSDQGGTGDWRTRLYLHKPENFNQYVVDRLELYEGDAITPLASTRPLRH